MQKSRSIFEEYRGEDFEDTWMGRKMPRKGEILQRIPRWAEERPGKEKADGGANYKLSVSGMYRTSSL